MGEKTANLVNCNRSERAGGRRVQHEILTNLYEFVVGVIPEEPI